MTAPEDGGLAAVLLTLAEFSARLARLEASLKKPPGGSEPDAYEIAPSIHWWSVNDEERTRAIDHLAGWVDQVFQPYYGHLAVTLGDCWRRHPLCLVQLDWLSELHGVLYFTERTEAILAAQAEYGTRIIPAVSEQFRKETAECEHSKSFAGSNGWKEHNGHVRLCEWQDSGRMAGGQCRRGCRNRGRAAGRDGSRIGHD